ncbi:hypothetical protein C4559_05330 [Candidatus Microgenomates bacterium]|nr:MAG: hypothetical protein C4559_05330 [Candidatus Microgenomates bacterium]
MGKERKKSRYTPEQIEEIKRARVATKASQDAEKAEYSERLKRKRAEVKILLDEMLFGKEVGMADAELTVRIKKALSAGGVDLLPESKLAVLPVYSSHVMGFDLYEVEREGVTIRHPESTIDRIRVNYAPAGFVTGAYTGVVYDPVIDVQRFIVFGENASTATIDATRVLPSMIDRLDLTAGLARSFLPQQIKTP